MKGKVNTTGIPHDQAAIRVRPCLIVAEVAQAHDGSLGMAHAYIDAIAAGKNCMLRRAFDMKVQAYDPFRNGWVEGVKRFEKLETFLKSSEVLSLHVSLASETEGLVGHREISQLPKGALLINTSRGKIVNERAVLMALEENHLGGAALDVLSDELAKKREIFDKLRRYAVRNDNLILTPHLGGLLRKFELSFRPRNFFP
jgi:phosphoglycerate dehydrogenase-like enzyme